MEELLITWIREYGYIILFLWCILEGEMALIMGGILSHTGDMNVGVAIFIAGLGGFAGDQIYFYVGRYNKKYIQRIFKKQSRKFAIANILLRNHGSKIIFVQRYMYGLRTIIPISIGLTKYNAKKFASINLVSAWIWASITIIPAWYFGEEILAALEVAKRHWYFAIPVGIIFAGSIFLFFRRVEKNILLKRRKRYEVRN